VEALLSKGAIEEVPLSPPPPCYISPIFLIPKKSGNMRPILKLKKLNAAYLDTPYWMGEHKKAAVTQKWLHSGITQHKENCHLPVDWENPTVIATMQHKNKNKLVYDLKICKALEIRKAQCGTGKGLNEEFGSYVRSGAWAPVFNKL
jgi:hypothetical protein